MSIVAFSHHISHYWKVFLSGTSYLYSRPYIARCAVRTFVRMCTGLLMWVSRVCQLLAINTVYAVLYFTGSFG